MLPQQALCDISSTSNKPELQLRRRKQSQKLISAANLTGLEEMFSGGNLFVPLFPITPANVAMTIKAPGLNEDGPFDLNTNIVDLGVVVGECSSSVGGAITDSRISGSHAEEVINTLKFQNSFLIDAHSPSDGIQILWNDSDSQLSIIGSSSQAIHAQVSSDGLFQCYVSFVYEAPRRSLHFVIWDDLVGISGRMDGLWLVLVDFNAMITSRDKQGEADFNPLRKIVLSALTSVSYSISALSNQSLHGVAEPCFKGWMGVSLMKNGLFIF
ncbi:hypothetical protein LINGRAHAP2_LOCUS34888 [Linum grandiflorum]